MTFASYFTCIMFCISVRVKGFGHQDELVTSDETPTLAEIADWGHQTARALYSRTSKGQGLEPPPVHTTAPECIKCHLWIKSCYINNVHCYLCLLLQTPNRKPFPVNILTDISEEIRTQCRRCISFLRLCSFNWI